MVSRFSPAAFSSRHSQGGGHTTATMRGAIDDPLVQRIMNYQASMACQHFAEGATIFAPDVAYVVPGNNPLIGHYEGPEAVMGISGGRWKSLAAATRSPIGCG
jgi:hypothetical protein